jgi:hypothetical protein
MTCPHAQTTTVLWCHGEAPDAHAEHVAGCAECQAVLDDHELVSRVVAPLAPALSAPAPRRSWRPWGAAAAVAALVLGWLLLPAGSPGPTPMEPAAPVPVALAPVLDDDDVDHRLDTLSLELDVLADDPSLL